MYHDSDNPKRHKKKQKTLCPACQEPVLRQRVYKDSVLFVHAEKKGLFGFTEITKACDVRKGVNNP